MSLIREWRASRERRRRADSFLTRLLTPPEISDVAWLSQLNGSRDIAERELVFARRALALIVAERDALDDRTASDVSHALSPVIDAESRRSSATAREWTARAKAFMNAMALRGQSEPPAVRLARVMLEGAGVTDPSPQAMERATQFVLTTRGQANEALRAVFGVASLPDDVRPSALRH